MSLGNEARRRGRDFEQIAEKNKALTESYPPRIPSKTWRECIKKVYEADPLFCPRCGGEMKIIIRP
jgi:hypothetical protein